MLNAVRSPSHDASWRRGARSAPSHASPNGPGALRAAQGLEQHGARFAFHHGELSGDESVDAMLSGSGGNALHAAVTLCDAVDVYGAGLHSAGVDADKIYAHAYDERVGQCLEPGPRPYKFGKLKGILGFFQWRKDRVRTEMLMHVFHALGVTRWVQ